MKVEKWVTPDSQLVAVPDEALRLLDEPQRKITLEHLSQQTERYRRILAAPTSDASRDTSDET